MNNIKNILLIAIITSTLVFGTGVIPIQSYADRDNGDDKKDKNFQSKISAGYESDKKGASQKMDKDNFCYRDDDCQQASEGQQIVGKDNEAKGFNDQSRNIQQQAVNPTPTPTQPPTPPTTGTLNICKTVVNRVPGLTFLPSDFTFNFSTPANPSTFQGANEGCTSVTVAPGTYAFAESIPQFVIGFGFNNTGGCHFVDITSNPEGLTDGVLFNGTIAAGETQTCALSNAINAAFPGGG